MSKSLSMAAQAQLAAEAGSMAQTQCADGKPLKVQYTRQQVWHQKMQESLRASGAALLVVASAVIT